MGSCTDRALNTVGEKLLENNIIVELPIYINCAKECRKERQKRCTIKVNER